MSSAKQPHTTQANTASAPQPQQTSGPLPEIPPAGLDLSAFESIIGTSADAEIQEVRKRAENVQKLADENKSLEAELEVLNARLSKAEDRRKELADRQGDEPAQA